MDRRISPTQKNTWLHKLCVLINSVQFNSLQSLSVSQFLTQREIVITGILGKNSDLLWQQSRQGSFPCKCCQKCQAHVPGAFSSEKLFSFRLGCRTLLIFSTVTFLSPWWDQNTPNSTLQLSYSLQVSSLLTLQIEHQWNSKSSGRRKWCL